MNKYEWIEAVMASELSKATKVFAFGIFKHMNEGKAWPGDDALMEATGSGRSHFSEYRKSLIKGGWLTVEPRKTQNGTSYYYYLPTSLPPVGNQTAPCGEQNAPSGEQTAPCGGMNTVVNTTRNTVKNTVVTTSPDGPVVPSPSNVEVRKDAKEEEVFALPLTVEEPAPVLTTSSRDAENTYGCGYTGTRQLHMMQHLQRDNKYGATAAKHCPIKEGMTV